MFAELPEARAVEPMALLLLALLMDAAVGDFRWLYRLLPHPVAAPGAPCGIDSRDIATGTSI